MSHLDQMCELLKLYYPGVHERAADIRYGYFPGEIIIEEEDGSLFAFDEFTKGIRCISKNRYDMTEEEYRREFSIRVRELMKRRRMKQTELSEAVGMSVAMISKYMNGKATPSLSVSARIAEVLECSIDDLLGYR